ncbi:MAG: class I SAM-dependent methyltransferase, partial [Rhodothermales bacterium]|nr:class I SAM-dependent methyltransferase [Rhodothermales bacterium]
PGGVVATLDFYRPPGALWNRLFLGYLSLSGKLYGLLWHREPAAYGYIAASIRQYLSAEEFAHALATAGFVVEAMRAKLGGGIGIHIASKKG